MTRNSQCFIFLLGFIRVNISLLVIAGWLFWLVINFHWLAASLPLLLLLSFFLFFFLGEIVEFYIFFIMEWGGLHIWQLLSDPSNNYSPIEPSKSKRFKLLISTYMARRICTVNYRFYYFGVIYGLLIHACFLMLTSSIFFIICLYNEFSLFYYSMNSRMEVVKYEYDTQME